MIYKRREFEKLSNTQERMDRDVVIRMDKEYFNEEEKDQLEVRCGEIDKENAR